MGIQCPVQKKLRPRNFKFSATSPYAHIVMLNAYRKKIDGNTETADKIQELLDFDPEFAAGIYMPSPK
jgi:hypothetical protein